MSNATSATEARYEEFSRVFNAVDDAIALATARELGVFAELRGGPLTLEELASRTKANAYKLRAVLELAAGTGWLRLSGGRFHLVDGDEAIFDPEGEYARRMPVRNVETWLQRWSGIVEVMRSGKGVEVAGTGGDVSESERRDFLMFLDSRSQEVAHELATLIGTVTRVADLGCGLGTYAHAVLRANPEATAVLIDRPNAAALVEEAARDRGLAGRLEFRGVDFLEGDIGDGYDSIVLSNVVHCYGAAENRRLIERCARALAPGGRLAIKDFEFLDDHSGPPWALHFQLMMAMFSEAGGVYSEATMIEWMADAGLEHAQTYGLRHSRESYLVIGSRA